ncbi:hypothetical protein AOV_01225 [Anaplasma ovis str. Haibei]|uniref:Uncharacterized protein n=1 Tax=Anaplasma ovis str. Haibei TaxID=1248439 RepID=A0A2Z2LI28_9RICK|nr:hypothetical protein AOV_01225 [Anaplasma ovis str. Haibei]
MFDFCAGEPDFLFVYISLLRGTATGVLCVRASLPDGCGLRTRDSRELCAFPPYRLFLLCMGGILDPLCGLASCFQKNTLVMRGATLS